MGIQSSINALDSTPAPTLTIVLCAAWEAECVDAYAEFCRANPEADWPSYPDWRVEWLEGRLWDEEIAEQRREAGRRGPRPCPADDDEAIPF